MLFDLGNLHCTALSAFDEMEEMGVQAKSDTTEFNERQFVFQIGSVLRQNAIARNKQLWTGFEYRFPGSQERRDQTRCDIVTWEEIRGTDVMAWIEVKSTGLDEYGNWKNALGKLGWEHDFEKLRGVNQNPWDNEHHRRWIWLYQFENYRKEVDDAFGCANAWTEPFVPSEIGHVFRRPSEGKVNLSRVISEIEEASDGILMSVCPRVDTYLVGKIFSAIIVTTVVMPHK